MTYNLLTRLRSLKKAEQRIAPDAAWVKATRATLLMQMKNTLPATNTLSLWTRVRSTFQLFAPRNAGTWMRRPAIAFMSLAAMLTGGSIMSVSAAEQALPGDFLYNLKLATEQARLAFTPVRSEKLQLKTEFTVRRVDELKRVADDSEHPDRVVQVAEILKRDLDTLKQQLGDVEENGSTDETVAAAKLVDQKSAEVINALQDTKSQLSPESIEKVTEAQSAAADTSIKAIEVLAEQHQQSSDVVPAEDLAQAIHDHVKAVSEATSSTALTIMTDASASDTSATTTKTLAEIMTSSTLASVTSSLPTFIKQMKDATSQAFVMQKAMDVSGTSTTSTQPVPMPILTPMPTSTTSGVSSSTTSTPTSASSTEKNASSP